MSYQVALLNFEGPLDLLLQLVERSRVEIATISLGDITASYIEHLEQIEGISPEDLQLFLELAARLMLLKSRALLPDASQGDEPEEVTELREQLEDYRRYQAASRQLLELLKSPLASHRRGTFDKLPDAVLPAPANVTSARLASAFSDVLRRLPPAVRVAGAPTVELAKLKASLNQRIKQGSLRLIDWLMTFSTREEVVVGFMALLELMRGGGVRAVQDDLFGDIIITNE